MSTSGQGDSGSIGNLSISIALDSLIAIFEIVFGLLIGSLALVADALHDVADVSSMSIGLWHKRGLLKNGQQHSEKYKKTAATLTFVNGTILLGVVILVIATAVGRLIHPLPLSGINIIIIASIALLGNLVASFLFKKERHETGLKIVWRRSWEDAAISLLVIIGGAVIYWTNIWWIDACLAIAIGLFIFKVIYEIVMEAIDLIYTASNSEK